MGYNIGVNVVEVDGAGAPSVTAAATSVGAFSVLTRRGIPDEPARITSFAQFVDRFGSYFPGGLGAYLVAGFFANGGRTAYVSRVCAPTAEPASRPLPDDKGATALTVQAGFRGDADPGTWARTVFLEVTAGAGARSRLAQVAPARIAGSELADAVDLSAATTLAVRVDGDPDPTEVRLQPTDFPDPAQATREQIRDVLNRKTHRLVASIDEHKALVLTSTGERRAELGTDWTSLEITAANPALGLAESAEPVLGEPAGLTAGGTRLARPVDFNPGDTVTITAGETTTRATLLTVDDTTGAVTWTPAITVGSFPQLPDIAITTSTFDLRIADGAPDADHVVETFTGLTTAPGVAGNAPDVLNNPLSGSRYVRLRAGAAPAAGAPAAQPAPTGGFVPLEGGSDGTPTANDFIGDPATGTGLHAFTPYDVQLLCCERTDNAIANAALAYCAGRGDAMFVGAVPQRSVGSPEVGRYTANLRSKNAYGALYGPWIIVPDPAGVGDNPLKTIPPVGHVMGVYARIEAARGIWKAPAGDEANLLGVLDVETRLSDADHTALALDSAVNGIRAVPRAGIVISASRTLSSDPRWRYVNVRLLFNFVKSSLRDGLRWAVQEPNRDTLWSAVKYGTVTPFLMGLWRQGAFGTGTPEQTFTVVVDAGNNPPDQVEQGMLRVEVYFYPSRPAEMVVLVLGPKANSVAAAES